ncbi:uncharacterized protein EI90DRAFT_3086771 [Cantharellus anzutake]|uniref:uncharacterized protein n=1 Tax=Cantharellus anzutake TaxID=1750568 RepID=UPI0019071237|nr:uncharacterized protein EI90DRAFT_3086771 [Cantharellus anzutake]KAF8316261.1 hypothetical protein EI90DRAFT_3086771 [Cantharellus anzutake]
MARIFSFPWALRALLLALCARVSLACTLYTPSTSQGITDEVQFQTSWTACTPPVTIQFWDKDTNTLLTSYSGSASTVYFTIHNGAGVTVYFVLIDSAGLKATSISYVVKPNLSLSSTSSPTFPPVSLFFFGQ